MRAKYVTIEWVGNMKAGVADVCTGDDFCTVLKSRVFILLNPVFAYSHMQARGDTVWLSVR